MTTITAELNAAADASSPTAKDAHIYAALAAWRRFVRAVKLAVGMIVLAALLLLAASPAGAQGPVYRTYHYWYLRSSEYRAARLYCNYRDGAGHYATWPARVSGYSGRVYCPAYRISY